MTVPGLAAPAFAKGSQGIPAWTTGSQTYIRIRPDVSTPPVAKVPNYTKLWIWGKKDGWFRVETPDHKFGWVYFDYVKSDSLEKVKELSDRRAKLASERTGNQRMYGSPQLLKKYYAKYQDKGAAKGLAMHGIYLARKPKPAVALAKAPAKAKPVVLAKAPATAKPVAAKPVVAKIAAKPAPRVSVAALPPTPPSEVAPLPANVSPAAERTNTAEVPAFPTGEAPAATAVTPALPPVAAEVTPVTKIAPLPVTKAAVTKPAVPKHSAPRNRRDAKRDELRQRLAAGSRSKSAPLIVSPVSPEELLKARDQYLANRNSRMGAPVSQAPGMPSQPAVILSPAPPAAVQPSSYKADGSTERTLGGPVVVAHSLIRPRPEDRTSLRDTEAQVRDEVTTSSTAGAGESAATPEAKPEPKTETASSAPAKAKPAAKSAPKAAAAPVSRGFIAYRGGSPRDRYVNRGGSPRDRYASNFGHAVANKALSYRGMPYIRGASSPSRGFDCSGLVYYCLRQRGLNPPRTAAGYVNYGKSVPVGQLKEGDLVLFANTYKRGVSHIGVYLGNGKFVHAATSGEGVRVDSLYSAYYSRKYYGARRVQ